MSGGRSSSSAWLSENACTFAPNVLPQDPWQSSHPAREAQAFGIGDYEVNLVAPALEWQNLPFAGRQLLADLIPSGVTRQLWSESMRSHGRWRVDGDFSMAKPNTGYSQTLRGGLARIHDEPVTSMV